MAEAFGREGALVVSGGAVGIDAAAHHGALVGGRTVAVLPNGFAPAYPAAHRALFERIVATGGGLLSELPDGTAPRKWTFLRRNELIAALADVVVVVQAPRGSGALATAAVARKLGKPVFVVPAACRHLVPVGRLPGICMRRGRGFRAPRHTHVHLGARQAGPVHPGHRHRHFGQAQPSGQLPGPGLAEARVHQRPEEHVAAHSRGRVDDREAPFRHRLGNFAPDQPGGKSPAPR